MPGSGGQRRLGRDRQVHRGQLRDPDAPLSARPRSATLATRYFASHGPATLQDFAWWTGLLVRDAQAGIEEAGSQLIQERRGGRSCWVASATPAGEWRRPEAALLPPWDEYIVAYKDRGAALGHLPANDDRLTTIVGNSLILIDGRVRGTWKRTLVASKVRVTLDFWTAVTDRDRRAVAKAAARYGRFLGKAAEIV